MLNSMFLDSLDSPPQTIELDLNVLYTLPQTIFFTKSLTTLKLCGCRLEQPYGTISFPFLKELSLDIVFVNEQMVQELTRECLLLEKLIFRYRWSVKRFCVSNALKLKVMEIFTFYDEVECFKIAAPSLEKCTPWFEKSMRILSLEALNNANNFFQWLYDQLRKKDAKCCSSQSIKYWRHDLKDCKIDGFTPYSDADDVDIDDSMKKLPKIPSGVLKFRLHW
ncbi:hypothetical protein EZV62_003906 [Acer yangbiense]|uniref:F-box/LRR-repeat protein 15/At3g58940/PEG3-like LRR domain-containing protein n=1 Tax=Acer yangbiense TaxID=1000413 RepID=A0A5C7IIL0_9ROSI|nr:hypothetical protein EZV62_003906 [Acer yangbiense]